MTRSIDIRLLPHPVARDADEPALPSEAGAECLFVGRTRGENHPIHGPLLRLDYHAYEPMALHVLHALADAALADFGCRGIRIYHATGPVAVGEASVLVHVACGHRDKAFAACRMLIDRLKSEAPIWKREVWADGTTWSEGTMVAVDRAAPHAQGSVAP